MATSKQYAYYLEGNKIAIIEKDVSFDNDVDSKDYGPGASRQRWESPKSTVTDGLKIKYNYAPIYYKNATTVDTTLTHYSSSNGFLIVYDSVPSFTDYDAILNVGDYFILENAGNWNGVHKVASFASVGGTNNVIHTDTSAAGIEAVSFTFSETPSLYTNVSYLEDESFELDLPTYLQKALVYYVKAKLAEDVGELKLREYAMREFKKMIEKHENAKISGLRIVSPGSHSIR